MRLETEFLHSIIGPHLHKESNLEGQLHFLKTITSEQTQATTNQGTRCILWPLDLLFPLLKCYELGGEVISFHFQLLITRMSDLRFSGVFTHMHVGLLKHAQCRHNKLFLFW